MTLLDDWISIVKNKFGDGCPNGFLLEWDVNRYHSSIKEICRNCKVTNQTDFNYAYCNTYEIRPETRNTKFIYELTLNISFIVDAFSLHWTKYTTNLKKGGVISSNEIEVEYDPTDGLIKFLEKNEYQEVKSDWFEINIDDVQLELAEKATLGKCLFHDYE